MIDAKTRFFQRIEKLPNGCWKWRGYIRPKGMGYGEIGFGGRSILVHRYSWLIHFGEIPTGKSVLHKCDNPSCVNPEHLFLGTHADNMADCVRKGRQSKGEQRYNSKLTDSDVRTISSLIQAGETYTDIGRRFGIKQSSVSDIASGRIWKHVKRPSVPNKRQGELRPDAKMTTDKVKQCIAMVRSGMTHKSVADHFGVTAGAISQIMIGKTWKHVSSSLLG